jgi:16S rRNA (cytidine1402-2'-O)-methyltransferase
VARELTKLHEELIRGRLSEIEGQLTGREVLGEVVVLVEGRTGDERWSEAEVRAALEEGLGRGEKLKPLSKEVAARAGWKAADVYRLGLPVP